MKLVIWGLVIVALCYAAYSGMIAAWSWIAVNNAVDEILTRDGIEALPEREIKTRIMQSTNEAGVPINEREVTVTHYDDRTVRVDVAWKIPVVVMHGDTVLAVPLSVKRSSTATAAAAVKR
jgi:hypothetical protein